MARLFHAVETSNSVKILFKVKPLIGIQAAIEHEPYVQVRFVCTDGIIIDVPKTRLCEGLCISLINRIKHLKRMRQTPTEIWKVSEWKKNGLLLENSRLIPMIEPIR